MVRNVSSALKAWKNADAREYPVAELYTIQLDDVTIQRYVSGDPLGTGSVTYDGDVYTSAAIVRQPYDQNLEGTIPSFGVNVSNVDGIAGGLIETYDLRGQTVTITQVLLPDMLVVNSLSDTFTIQDQSYNRKTASFSLSHANYFNRRTLKQFVRWKCRWNYGQRHQAGDGCGYPRDEFEPDTEQDFVVGGAFTEKERAYGWFTINTPNASQWSVNIDRLGLCHISSLSNGIDWDIGDRSGPFMYKKFSGDFDVFTEIDLEDSRPGAQGGLVCQSQSTPSSWVVASRRHNASGAIQPYIASALADVAGTTAVAVTTERFIRMQRIADIFNVFHAESADGPWTLYNARAVALGSETNVGFLLSALQLETGRVSINFPYFRATKGGLATCDRTIDGFNGCKAHKNLHRIFLFRGVSQAR
jgi:phage-related protein